MNKRINELTKLTLSGEMYVNPTHTEFDRKDMFLSEEERNVKRLCEYILNQEPKITPYSKMTGFFNFDGSVVGDAFNRSGHKYTGEFMSEFYLKPIDNLSTMEWQHATADYKKVLKKGLKGIIEEIDQALKIHTEKEKTEFLNGMKKVAFALINWAKKCSERALEFSKTVENREYKNNLVKLSDALKNVPKNKATSFYEAVLCIYVCFSADPDSFGTLDRYLTQFYENDIKNGVLKREEAKEYLQELFLMVQAVTPVNSQNFTRGGQSHFCIGGYLKNKEDGFNDLSRLITESLIELPTYIPEITFRWTKKTPREVLRFMMDCERKDKNKRIAFTNDEKRLKAYTQICNIPFERAIEYTMVGCNEPVLVGEIIGSNSKGNILRCVETIFHKKSDITEKAKSFEEFYEIFENELFSDLGLIFDYDDKYNIGRSKDINYISSLFFNGCIESGKSLTQGGGDYVISSPMLLGTTNVIDSLAIVKQFVFDEKEITMKDLINALKNNWNGYAELRNTILKKGNFFGNDDDTSNYVAQKFYNSLYSYCKGKKNIFGYPYLAGDLLGYNEHHKWFGEKTNATPDGRKKGDLIKFGIGQSEGKDRNDLLALLNSIAKADKNAILCGSTVTNITLEEKLVRDDENFEKLVDVFQTYFENGGVHFQPSYVSKEELIKAKKDPEKYKNLRVRVTGFSEYFVNLQESVQDDIIKRTSY